uniref:Uncharacterized protein n=1 Tax=Plectus sambesii TaxID=2011161 RepID=A0A914WMR5_9BILA
MAGRGQSGQRRRRLMPVGSRATRSKQHPGVSFDEYWTFCRDGPRWSFGQRTRATARGERGGERVRGGQAGMAIEGDREFLLHLTIKLTVQQTSKPKKRQKRRACLISISLLGSSLRLSAQVVVEGACWRASAEAMASMKRNYLDPRRHNPFDKRAPPSVCAVSLSLHQRNNATPKTSDAHWFGIDGNRGLVVRSE